MLKFGVFDHMDRNGDDVRSQYDDRLRLIEAYDRAGFYAYHVAEHHSTPLGCSPSPSVFLSAIAQRTRSLRFGPLVYTLSLYHPLRLYEEICMLDQMSGGRLELGIGRGISPIELGFYGVDVANAQGMYAEATEILLKAFAGDRLDFEGAHFKFKNVPIEIRSLQRPHPPLWLGVTRPEGTAWAAANRVNIVSNGRADQVQKVAAEYRRHWQASPQADQPMPKIGMSRHVVVADDPKEARAIGARAYAKWYASLMYLWRAHGAVPATLSFPESFDEAVEAGYGVAGTADMVRDELGRQAETAGVNYILCRFAFGDLSYGESLRSVELFRAGVMPAFEARKTAA